MRIPRASARGFFIVITLVLITIPIVILFRIHFLFSTLLFFGLPSAYLIWCKPSNLKKATLAALLFGVLWGFSFDYIAEFNHAWGWSTNTVLMFPTQLFGVVSLDIMVWYFLWIFLIVAFYEYFAEFDFSKRISPNALWATLAGIGVAIGAVFVSKVVPSVITFQYPYLVLGTLTLITFAIIVLRRPWLFPKLIGIAPFFIFVYLVFELTALHLQLWGFPGHYIGSVHILNLSFPFEELIFWIIASSAVAASYHEYCIDDQK